MSFFNELKRRNVFRVGAAYLVVAWLLLQVMDTVGPIINLSDAFARGVLFLLAAGFPVALIVSWIYEMTPEGLATQDAVDAGMKSTSGRKMNAVIITGLLLVIVLLVVDNYLLNEPADTDVAAGDTNDTPFAGEITQTAGLDRSIAVLPFDNQSNDPDQEYFSDGLTDELINKLSQVQDLLVIGRNSSFYFKDSNEDLRDIGELLNVSYILQGSVRKSGNQLRVTAQLMEAGTGFNLWSQTFDRELADVFAIQDEIAQDVTTNLSVSLGVGEFDRPGMTRNVAAYDAFLRGWQILRDVGFEPEQAIEQLQVAVDLDPNFAMAWAGLGWVYYLDALDSPIDELDDLMGLSRNATQRARNLAIDLPETLAAEAQLAQSDGNWIDADRQFRELISEYGDTDSSVNVAFGNFLQEAGKPSESLVYFQRARRLDPLNAQVSRGFGVSLAALDRFDEANEEADRGLALQNAAYFRFLHAVKTVSAYARNDLQQAVALLHDNAPGQEEYDMALPLVEKLAAGETGPVIEELRAIRNRNFTPIQQAILQPVAALTGDAELALAYMQPGTNQIGLWMRHVRPYFNEPEAKQAFRDIGLLAYWQASGWGDFCQPVEGNDDFVCN